MPTSSSASRRAVSSADSPASPPPPGSSQLSSPYPCFTTSTRPASSLKLTDVVDTWVAQTRRDPSDRQRPGQVGVPPSGDHPSREGNQRQRRPTLPHIR